MRTYKGIGKYHGLDGDLHLDSSSGGGAFLRTNELPWAELSPEQVDDLIDQLCAIRGHQSPIELPRRTVIREEKIAVPRFVRFRPTGNSDDLLLWKDASGRLRGWYVTSSVKEPWPGGADSRHGTVGGWDAEPCTASLLDPKDPAYLRAVADLLDGKGTTTVTRPVTVFERVAVPGVSGDDFTKGGVK